MSMKLGNLYIDYWKITFVLLIGNGIQKIISVVVVVVVRSYIIFTMRERERESGKEIFWRLELYSLYHTSSASSASDCEKVSEKINLIKQVEYFICSFMWMMLLSSRQ